MSDNLGSAANPLRVAIFGSGPSGFYAAEELLKQEDPFVAVDMFDRLPVPFGLVRGGVAPDHPKIKTVTKLFERTADRARFRFFGNVAFGRDLSLDEVLDHYHQVLFCTGAESDRRMGIPGEELAGSHPATAFVAWYNGHPDYRHHEFDLSAETAVVVGIGNVAMDVARILTRPVEELAQTDIAEHALEALKVSKVRNVYLLGRRGPAQAAFTNPEIRELGEIQGTDLVLRADEVELDDVSREYLEGQSGPASRRNVEILQEQAQKGQGTQQRKIFLRFLASPVELKGGSKVEAVVIEKNRLEKDSQGWIKARGTGETEEVPAGLVFRSIGYLGTGLPGIPFDERSGIIPNDSGRVTGTDGTVQPRLYVAGWIKRGPSGVIGTNKPDSIATVKVMVEDFQVRPQLLKAEHSRKDIGGILDKKGVRHFSFEEWRKIDEIEQKRGQAKGKPREKFTSLADILKALG